MSAECQFAVNTVQDEHGAWSFLITCERCNASWMQPRDAPTTMQQAMLDHHRTEHQGEEEKRPKICGAISPFATWICDREPGHDGEHEQRGDSSNAVER